MHGKRLLCAALLAACAGGAFADELVLANGDRLTGKVVSKETDEVVFHTDYAGDLKVRWADVRGLTTDGPVKLYMEDGRRVKGRLRTEADGTVVVVGEGAEQGTPVDIAKLRYLNPSVDVSGEGARLSGHANAGYSSTAGNTETTKLYVDTELVARTLGNRYTLGARGSRAEDHDVETESNWLGYLKYDHFLTKKWYGYANGDFENDRFKDIRLRSTVGLGSGYQFFESEKTNLLLEGGVNYVRTDFYADADEDYPAARWAVKYDHLLFGSRTQFFYAHEMYVGLDNVENTFLRMQTGLRVPLFGSLNATAQYNVDWDNNPPAGRVRTDRAVLLTLGYTW
ncbi:MAG TPA: DUF481 domain-containing protein [Burkholderiales bacterium]|nr:DUF481 domain-containing protein [Burkholderiales bacterium]